MVERGPHFGMETQNAEAGEGEGIDVDRLREMAGFVARAPRRHPVLATVVFLVIASLGLTIAAAMPATYRASVKLLIQRSSAIRALTSANQQLQQMEWENPTKNIQEMIMRRDNLVALVRDANLTERVAQTRPAALRFKDAVMAQISGPMTDDDKQKAMVYTLETKLNTEVLPDEATVVISVDWSNPAIAYDLVTLVQKNFEGARYDSDVAVINDSVAVLEDHAKRESAHVDAEIAAYQQVVATRAVPSSTTRPMSAVAVARAPGGAVRTVAAGTFVDAPDPDLAKALEAKRAQIRSLEETHQRALDAVRQQLVQAQLTLTPLHPSVIALQQSMDAMSQPPPELAQARADERALMAQIAPPRIAASAPASTAALAVHSESATADGGAPEVPPLPRADPTLDGPLRLAESKLTAAIHSYEDSINRIDAARAELDITRAAYKHRYTVVTPPELPKKPSKPTARLVAIGSVVGGFLLAMLLSALADLAKGTIQETWQIRRQLKVDVLCELDQPS